MEKELFQYGALGLIVLGMGYYILMIEKEHRKEREGWRQILAQQQDRMNEMSDESNRIIRENTNILIGLKTLLENRLYDR